MESEKNQAEIIPAEAIIDLQFSGSFYRRVQQALLHFASYREEDEITELIEKINTDVSSEEYDEWEVSMETLMILCSEVERRATEQGVTKTVDITTTEAPATNI